VSYAISWSGGKDGCFACYEAINNGYNISHLVNFISEEHGRVRSHGIDAEIIKLQAEAIGIPLLQRAITRNGYEETFKEAMRTLIPHQVKGIIFGDIHIQGHKDWVERVCGELGIEAVEPLWGRDPEKILLDFMDAGFEAIIVSTKLNLINKEWIGHKVDREFLSYLKENNIDACGENGEYHTFVTYGPIFKKKVRIHKSKTTTRDNHWFLETTKYSL
jgi:uncharacterized protein (TIGR00290 family)